MEWTSWKRKGNWIMIINDQDKNFIDFAWGCINRARYADSQKIVDTYNRVFSDRVNFTKKPYTSCGSCLRSYCAEMKREMDATLAKMEVPVQEKDEKKINESIKDESIKDEKRKEEVVGEPRKKKTRAKVKKA